MNGGRADGRVAGRIAGVALLAGGVFAAFFWPSLTARHGGEPKARLEVFDRADGGWERGWKSAQVTLSPADNPVQIVVEAEFLPGTRRSRPTTGLLLVVARGGEAIGEERLELSLPGQAGGDRQPRVSSAIASPFRVTAAGAHTISVRSTENEDMDFARARAEIRVGVKARDFSLPGYGAIVAGALLLFLSGGRKKRRRRA